MVIGHASEVRQGIRFEFGKNWERFLGALTDERIAIAELSLVEYLRQPRLGGLRFLDIGSGSGLFSLAARRLGAKRFCFGLHRYGVRSLQPPSYRSGEYQGAVGPLVGVGWAVVEGGEIQGSAPKYR